MIKKVSTVCCGEDMNEESSYTNGEDGTCHTCLKCAGFVSIIRGQLDEEDLENYRAGVMAE